MLHQGRYNSSWQSPTRAGKEDVCRIGRSSEYLILGLTNKVLNSFQVKAEVLDDDDVFGDDADEDNFTSYVSSIPMRALLLSVYSGLFGDLTGEDYLGLEASGILSEFGLGSLTIPKRLWKGKKNGAEGSVAKSVLSLVVSFSC